MLTALHDTTGTPQTLDSSLVETRIVRLDEMPTNQNDTCTVYRNTPMFGNRYVFVLPDERRQMLDYQHKESAHHSHYIVCGHASESNQTMRGVRHSMEKRSETVDSSAEEWKRPTHKIASPSISTGVIVALQCVYSIFGIVASFLVCRLFKIPRFYRQFSFMKEYKWINYLLELAVLFSTFYNVDEYIDETQFPVGIYRTFLSYTMVAILLYYVNRSEHNVRRSWSSRLQMYNYDRCYMHWLFCSIFLIGTHTVYIMHGYYQTIVSLSLLVVIYALMHLFCRYEHERYVRRLSKHYFWHRLSDTCTHIESSLFVG